MLPSCLVMGSEQDSETTSSYNCDVQYSNYTCRESLLNRVYKN